MISYASQTSSRKNLAMLQRHGWRLLISRAGGWKTHGFRYCLDNGAWHDHTHAKPFDSNRFQTLIDALGRQADFVIAPDIVCGGIASLQLSVVWLAPLLQRTSLVLVPVQNGMGPQDLVSIVLPNRIGIFIGGDTAWKETTMLQWGDFASQKGIYMHVGRVNTARRVKLAQAAGAWSIDGSSGSRWSKTVPPLDHCVRQWDMWTPPNTRADQLKWAAMPAPGMNDCKAS